MYNLPLMLLAATPGEASASLCRCTATRHLGRGYGRYSDCKVITAEFILRPMLHAEGKIGKVLWARQAQA